MKILFILSGTTSFGGATKSFLNLIEYLKSHGTEIFIVCPDKKGIYNFLLENGFNTFQIPYNFSTRPTIKNFKDVIKFVPRLVKRKLINWKASTKLSHLVSKISPDIIHTNSSVIKIGYDVSLQHNIPHIFHIREYGDIDFNLDTSYITNIISEGRSYSISITKDIAKHKNIFNSFYNSVIYNGIVKNEKIRFNKTKQDFFLFAGRIEPTKGLDELIDAYADYLNCSKKKYKLVIAGGIQGQYKSFYESLCNKISDYKISEFVEWVGERTDIEDYMYHAAATIIPSYNEGFGRVMVEAMTNGSLCIARNTGGSKEQLDNGRKICKKEIALPFNTKYELTKQLIKVSDTPTSELSEIIMRSQEVIQTLYSQDTYGDKTLQLYNKILNN